MTFSLRTLLLLLLLISLLLAGGAAWSRTHDRAQTAPGVYAALGASDTVGIGADHPSADGWVPLVHAALPPGTQLLNLGISGATLRDVLAQQAPVAVDVRPQWVSIWPGVNDLRAGVDLETFAGQLDTLLGQLGQRSAEDAGDTHRPTVVVLNIPDLRSLPVFAHVEHAALDTTVRMWNAAIADAANRHGAIVVDLYARWPELREHPEYISGDGFHPSNAGYRRIADLVLDSVEPGRSPRRTTAHGDGGRWEAWATGRRLPLFISHVSSSIP